MARGKKGATAPVNPRSTTEPDKALGIRIRINRINKGISQSDLGKLLKVSFQQIQKYEKGTNRLSATKLAGVARALETTPNDLLDWNGRTKIDVSAQFDQASYMLAREFDNLPEVLKSQLRHLVGLIIECVDK
jgi:transcriptional regulator with XRE-family HTH domain